jgi:MIP family channel proteins
MRNWQKYLAEAFGTFVLVGIGGGVMMGLFGGAMQMEMSGAPFDGLAFGALSMLAAAFAFGFAWIAALYTVGRISGGHFNPVLSLAAFLDRAILLKDMLVYWVAQFVGAVGAIGIFAWLFSADATVGAGNSFGSFDGFKAFSVEAILTLILTMAFLTLLRSQAHTKYLGMGFALFAVTLLGFGVTTAGVNPARAFAPALFSGDGWDQIWVYFVGPIVGAIAGWVLYRIIVRGDTDFTDDLGEIADAVV